MALKEPQHSENWSEIWRAKLWRNFEDSKINRQIQSYLTTDVQSASLFNNQAIIWDQRPFFLSRHWKLSLDTCGFFFYYGVPFLTRDWVCNLQLLLGLTSLVSLGSETRGTHDHTSLSQFWDSPNLVGQVPVSITSATAYPSSTLSARTSQKTPSKAVLLLSVYLLPAKRVYQPFTSNRRLFRLRYSRFQLSRHNIIYALS
jgi:hypothetical protein